MSLISLLLCGSNDVPVWCRNTIGEESLCRVVPHADSRQHSDALAVVAQPEFADRRSCFSAVSCQERLRGAAGERRSRLGGLLNYYCREAA